MLEFDYMRLNPYFSHDVDHPTNVSSPANATSTFANITALANTAWLANLTVPPHDPVLRESEKAGRNLDVL